MSDEEWLDYFEIHCRTPRAGFVKDNIDRLCDLAGEPRFEGLEDGVIYSLRPDFIDPLVNRARERLVRNAEA
jgi:hypothetical protein